MNDHTKPQVKVVVASGSADLAKKLIEQVKGIYPELPLYVISEFPLGDANWIPYHVPRSFYENWTRSRVMLEGKNIRFCAVLFQPKQPFALMRLLGFLLAPLYFAIFNRNLDHFMLRPRSMPGVIGHFLWTLREWFVFQFNPGGDIYTFVWRLGHPHHLRRPIRYACAVIAGWIATLQKHFASTRANVSASTLLEGITVITDKPGEFAGASEVIVGAPDKWQQARYSHVCLLRTSHESELLTKLRKAFDEVPDLFAATTRKTALIVREQGSRDTSFPVVTQNPINGENQSYVLYGSSDCALYSMDKLRQLHGLDEAYSTTFAKDLDVAFRAWQRGWPTVQVSSNATALAADEQSYLQFLMRAVASPTFFCTLWKDNLKRLNLAGAGHVPSEPHVQALGFAMQAPRWTTAREPQSFQEEWIIALTSGQVAVFPGRKKSGRKVVLIASPYIPFPLSHGGAVRIYNLMKRAAPDFDLVLVTFMEELKTPPQELLDITCEVVAVKRLGSHLKRATDRPDVVEEFDTPAFHAALRQTVKKWSPQVAQLEYTQMAQYAEDCHPAKTCLVEHDITFDLFEQMLKQGEDWELRRQYTRWRNFEIDAWQKVDKVIVMSEKDRAMSKDAVIIPNGVDLQRFQPSDKQPDPKRLLFIGSFAHLPNVAAIDFFLREVWPHLGEHNPTLHIIAGARHRYYLDRYRDRIGVNLDQKGIEIEDFVSDVRPAYERAAIVVAPLLASAGTNIKIMEAMAMGKAIVSTPGGVNGLEVRPGVDVLVTQTGREMIEAISRLLENPQDREAIQREARKTVEKQYDWDVIAKMQKSLYDLEV